MDDKNSIAANQKKIGEQLERDLRNYKKDGPKRKTLKYAEKKIREAEEAWTKFQKNDDLLKTMADQEWPYFKDAYYTTVKEIFDVFLEELKKLRTSLQPEGKDSELDNPDDKDTDTDTESDDKQNSDTTDGDTDNDTRSKKKKKANRNRYERPQGRFQNGKTSAQNLQLFDMKLEVVERHIAKLDKMLQENTAELTYFRNIEDLRDSLKELTALDHDIHIHGDITSRQFLQFLTNDIISQVNERADNVISQYERKMDTEEKNKSKNEKPITDMDVKLPRIIIPKFAGTYDEWQTFYDLYTRLIHNNVNLSNAMKMQYLTNSLTNDAARLIKHFTAKAENYDVAWELLVDKYKNKRALVHDAISKLMKIPYQNEPNNKALQEIHDELYNIFYSLEGAMDKKYWGEVIILQIILRKMDKETFKEYEDGLTDPRELQSLAEFMTFLNKRITHLESLDNNFQKSGKFTKKQNNTAKSFNKIQENNRNGSNTKLKENVKCYICSESHKLQNCKLFASLTAEKRDEKSKQANLCRNCLSNKHTIKDCKSKNTCNKCKQQHHTMLHDENWSKRKKATENNKVLTAHMNDTHSFTVNKPKEGVILTTALVQILVNGYTYMLRALLDQGSTTNILTEEAAKLLNLRRHKTYAEISGLGNSLIQSKEYCNMKLQSIYNADFKLDTSAFILRNVTETTPSTNITGNWEHLENLKLADPQYKISSPIDIILGGGIYARALLPGVIKAGKNDPIAQQTELGWIISGPREDDGSTKKEITLVTHIEEEFNLQNFWKLEELPDRKALTIEEMECEDIYKRTHIRQENGKYMVQLPFKEDDIYLGKSRHIAIATLLQLEKVSERIPN